MPYKDPRDATDIDGWVLVREYWTPNGLHVVYVGNVLLTIEPYDRVPFVVANFTLASRLPSC
jgi:hypothetical protein